jgi:NitT/TauT family transport system permease protein
MAVNSTFSGRRTGPVITQRRLPAIWLLRAGLLAGFIGLWQLAAHLGWIDAFFYGTPTGIAASLVDQFVSGSIWKHLLATVEESLIGLLIGFLAGGFFGWIAAERRLLGQLIEPAMALMNAIPRIVLAPLFILWFGFGTNSRVALAFIMVFVAIFFAVYNGIKEVDPVLVERVRILGGGSRDILTLVYIPSVAAWVFSSLRLAVGFAFTGALVAEVMAGNRGLGYLMNLALNSQNADLMMATVILIMVMIVAVFAVVGRIETWATAWKRPG